MDTIIPCTEYICTLVVNAANSQSVSSVHQLWYPHLTYPTSSSSILLLRTVTANIGKGPAQNSNAARDPLSIVCSARHGSTSEHERNIRTLFCTRNSSWLAVEEEEEQEQGQSFNPMVFCSVLCIKGYFWIGTIVRLYAPAGFQGTYTSTPTCVCIAFSFKEVALLYFL